MQILAPIEGLIVPLENISDPVFAQKLAGDGIGIEPTSGTVVSPVDGVVAHLHPAHHALTLRTPEGIEILIHVGLETVALKGDGFRPLVQKNDSVKKGQKLLTFDEDFVALKAKSLVTLVLVSESQGQNVVQKKQGRVRSGQDVVFELTGKTLQTHTPSSEAGSVVKISVQVPFATGLHARPAAQLVHLVKSFRSKISIEKNSRRADARSMVGLMGLEIEHHDHIDVLMQGPDAMEASTALRQFFAVRKNTANEMTEAPDSKILRGFGIGKALITGKIHPLTDPSFEIPSKPSGTVEQELQQIHAAISEAQNQLAELVEKTKQQGLNSEAEIFAAHAELLDDPSLLDVAKTQLGQKQSAAMAWNYAIEKQVQVLSTLKNSLFAGRAVDLRDVGLRVLRIMVPQISTRNSLPENAIVVAENVTPSDVATFDLSRVVGFCSVNGNSTSHVAILARSLGIPALLGVHPSVLALAKGREVLLDSESGFLNTDPSASELKAAETRRKELELREEAALKHAHESATTIEGRRVLVHANISSIAEARMALERGAEGVGLLRTEFLFFDRAIPPTEDEQLQVYQQIRDILGERPLTIRTLDVGGDKPPSFLDLPQEDNPFLGLRGIRVSLQYPEIFRTQIRAVLSVKSRGPLNLMFPMIASLSEFQQAKELVKEEMKDFPDSEIHMGVMVETPAAALIADELAFEAEFFSIGTNDLTQYTLAMDRGNAGLEINPLHPGVLKLIQMTVEAAHRHRRWVGVCGDLAGNEKAIPLLVQMGVDELSAAPPSVPLIKQQIRQLSQRIH